MSNEEVIEMLAGRLKWKVFLSDGLVVTYDENGCATSHMNPASEHPLLKSRDTLVPVLEGLSEDESKALIDLLCRKNLMPSRSCYLTYVDSMALLTLPPRNLAHAIAEVLK